jgi:DNA mismatch endonuclease (patch repair protein)
MPLISNNKKRSLKKAGHRSWAAGNAPVPGKHKGDIMSPEKRSKVMARIKGKNTGPERIIFALLRNKKVYFAKHAKELPGRPDIVFRRAKLAIFIDGDFWHGWRFPLWEHKLSEKWRVKIANTRKRDQKNFRKLRKLGWKVLRIWEHQIERSPEKCVDLILRIREERLNIGN